MLLIGWKKREMESNYRTNGKKSMHKVTTTEANKLTASKQHKGTLAGTPGTGARMSKEKTQTTTNPRLRAQAESNELHDFSKHSTLKWAKSIQPSNQTSK